MRKILSCPQPGQIEKFATGDVPVVEMEGFVEHLQSCADCLAKVQTLSSSDTLTDSLRKAALNASDSDDELVNNVVERLKKLVQPSSRNISFTCPTCGKKLRTKSEFAGKKAKCPGCGNRVVVQAGDTLAPDNAQQPTPADGSVVQVRENSTIAFRSGEPKADTLGSGKPPMADAEATIDPASVSASADDRWDFLAPAEQPDEIGRLGPYRVLSVLGHGGMGVVFRAEDPKLERLVALKAMLPSVAASESAKTRFLREAKTAASIKHDHIITIFEVGEDRGAPFLAMEFLEGEPLDERLKREPILPLPEILRIGREIADGLAAAHDKGLIHRDIKPGNVWLETRDEGRGARGESTTRGEGHGTRGEGNTHSSLAPRPSSLVPRIKILDFGLARSTNDDVHLTQSGAIVGTPAYMAPEQAMGADVDHRVDLFSLGCVLYRLCTGEMPFQGKNAMAILASIAMETPKPPHELNPQLPRAMTDLIDRLLAKEADSRPESARDVAAALLQMEEQIANSPTAKLPRKKSVSKGQNKLSKPASKTATAPPPLRRKLVLAAGGLGLLAVLLSGIVFFMQTPNGVIRVEVNDPNIQVKLGKGELKLSGVGSKEITIQPGENWLHIERDGFNFKSKDFVLRRGKTVTLAVTWLDGKVSVTKDGTVFDSGRPPQPKGATPKAVLRPQEDYALDFDGKTSHVVVRSWKYDGKIPLTLEAWATSRTIKQSCILSNQEQSGLGIELNRIGYLSFQMHDGFGYRIVVAPTEVKAGKSFHVAAVFDLKQLSIYVNGRLEKSVPWHQGRTFAPDKFPTIIGGNPSGPTVVDRVYMFDGIIDELRISKCVRYDKEFAPKKWFAADIDTIALYHFDEGQGDKLVDSSGNGHHGKIVGAKWVKVNNINPTADVNSIFADLSKDAWKRLLDTPATIKDNPDAKWTEGGVHLSGKTIMFPELKGSAVAIKAKVKFLDEHNVSLRFRRSEKEKVGCFFLRSGFFGVGVSFPWKDLATETKSLPDLEFHDIGFRVEDGTITAQFDGHVVKARTRILGESYISIAHRFVGRGAIFRDVQYQLLKQASKVGKNDVNPPSTDPDRRAAETILRAGGKVFISSGKKHFVVSKMADLLTEPFHLIGLGPMNAAILNADNVEMLRNCTRLERLRLDNQPIGDIGFARLAQFSWAPNVVMMEIHRTGITGKGFVHLKRFTKLGHFSNHSPNVATLYAKDLVHMSSLSNLRLLALHHYNLQSDATAHLRNLSLVSLDLSLNPRLDDRAADSLGEIRTLQTLALAGTAFGNAGLTRLDKLTRLEKLYLINCKKVTDDGLKELTRLPKLNFVSISGTSISDKGLQHLAAIDTLRSLEVKNTKVTLAGLKKLKAALPKCNIVSDFPELGAAPVQPVPHTDPDRRAAEWVVGIGGKLIVETEKSQQLTLDKSSTLPSIPFRVQNINLWGNSKTTDDGLANLAGLRHLLKLGINGAKITDDGLRHLKDCRLLYELDLGSTKIGDAGLIHLKNLPKLRTLYLGRTRVSDTGIDHLVAMPALRSVSLPSAITDSGAMKLAGMTSLEALNLSFTKITDQGVKSLAGLTQLRTLVLAKAPISDDALIACVGMTKLTSLNLENCKIRGPGIAHLAKLSQLQILSLHGTLADDSAVKYLQGIRSLRKLTLDETQITPAGLRKLREALPKCKITPAE